MNEEPQGPISKFVGTYLIPGLIILTMVSWLLDPIMLLHIAAMGVVFGVLWVCSKIFGWK